MPEKIIVLLIAVAFLSVIITPSLIAQKKDVERINALPEKEYCDLAANFPASRIPAKCLKYFQPGAEATTTETSLGAPATQEVETLCSDEVDNDQDLIVDASDSDCSNL